MEDFKSMQVILILEVNRSVGSTNTMKITGVVDKLTLENQFDYEFQVGVSD